MATRKEIDYCRRVLSDEDPGGGRLPALRRVNPGHPTECRDCGGETVPGYIPSQSEPGDPPVRFCLADPNLADAVMSGRVRLTEAGSRRFYGRENPARGIIHAIVPWRQDGHYSLDQAVKTYKRESAADAFVRKQDYSQNLVVRSFDSETGEQTFDMRKNPIEEGDKIMAMPKGSQIAQRDELSIWGDWMAMVEAPYHDANDPTNFDPATHSVRYKVYLSDIPADPKLFGTRISFKYGYQSYTEQPFYYRPSRGAMGSHRGYLKEPFHAWVPIPLKDLSTSQRSTMRRYFDEDGFVEMGSNYPVSQAQLKKLFKAPSFAATQDMDSDLANAANELMEASGNVRWGAAPSDGDAERYWASIKGVYATAKNGNIKFAVTRGGKKLNPAWETPWTYDEAHAELIESKWTPVPGSSRWEDGHGRTARIVPWPRSKKIRFPDQFPADDRWDIEIDTGFRKNPGSAFSFGLSSQTVMSRRYGDDWVKVLKTMPEGKWVNHKTVAKQLGLSADDADDMLSDMEDYGLLRGQYAKKSGSSYQIDEAGLRYVFRQRKNPVHVAAIVGDESEVGATKTAKFLSNQFEMSLKSAMPIAKTMVAFEKKGTGDPVAILRKIASASEISAHVQTERFGPAAGVKYVDHRDRHWPTVIFDGDRFVLAAISDYEGR